MPKVTMREMNRRRTITHFDNKTLLEFRVEVMVYLKADHTGVERVYEILARNGNESYDKACEMAEREFPGHSIEVTGNYFNKEYSKEFLKEFRIAQDKNFGE